MYQYALGMFFSSLTTTRLGLLCSNFSSQLLGYRLGLGKASAARTGGVNIAGNITANITVTISSKRNMVSLRVWAQLLLGQRIRLPQRRDEVLSTFSGAAVKSSFAAR